MELPRRILTPDKIGTDEKLKINFQRREENSLSKEVYLFYRAESEKWCIGPNPVGTFCWIYCDSQTKTPWTKAMSPFWYEHVGSGQWENVKITVTF